MIAALVREGGRIYAVCKYLAIAAVAGLTVWPAEGGEERKAGSEWEWHADAFAARVDQINAACGRSPVDQRADLSAQAERRLLEKADAVCDGMAFFYREEPVLIGKRDIDWTGGQKAHQEWAAQLNRFFMFEFLLGAYRQTREEKYAARARELMDDWFDFRARQSETFIDPQRNSPFNAALRGRNWIQALATFRNSAAFDEAFVRRAVEVCREQTNRLEQYTSAGPSNHQTAQAFSLLEAGLALDFLPDAKGWREKGAQVLAECFRRQFRSDGSHGENTTGYHAWMTGMMIDARALTALCPEPVAEIDLKILRRALSFMALSCRFAFNDSSYPAGFPCWGEMPDVVGMARRAGIGDLHPDRYGVYPEAGLVFGGNDRERFCFDAGPFTGWHTHLSRLSVEFGADGYSLLVDPAITTYERRDPHFVYGRMTRSHGTVNFNGAHQARENAHLLGAVLDERFAIVVGAFNGGGFSGEFSDHFIPNLEADQQRALLWLEGLGLLIFDRTRIRKSPDDRWMTRYVFPIAPMERWHCDASRSAWYSENRKQPNLLVQMLLKPVPGVQTRCAAGEETPELHGWVGTARDTMIPAPTLEFTAETGDRLSHAVTLVTASSPGRAVVPMAVMEAVPGRVDFGRVGDVPWQLRFVPDFRTREILVTAGVETEAVLLLVYGNSVFVHDAVRYCRNGENVSLEHIPYTGWIQVRKE